MIIDISKVFSLWFDLRNRNLITAAEYWFEKKLEEIERKSKEKNKVNGKEYEKDLATIDKDKRLLEKEYFGVFLDDLITKK